MMNGFGVDGKFLKAFTSGPFPSMSCCHRWSSVGLRYAFFGAAMASLKLEPTMLFDAHCHLQLRRDTEKMAVAATVERAMRHGVVGAAVCGCDATDWDTVEMFWRQFPDFVAPSFGLHPWWVTNSEASRVAFSELRRKLMDVPSAGVGECGLDGGRKKEIPMELQVEVLKAQLDLAKEFQRPVSLHCVAAHGTMLQVSSFHCLMFYGKLAELVVMSQMLQIEVALMSGNPELLTLAPSSTVQDVMTKAQRALGKKYLQLITAESEALVDLEQTLGEAKIQDGERLTAVILQPQLAATGGAFALWCRGGIAVVTWGHANFGGDSSAVQDQLKGLQHIQATVFGKAGAFAAILGDGSVVTWGDADCGGDSSAVRDQLKGVRQIHATAAAFAAILEDGSVVTWGDADDGGDSSAVRDQLEGVQQIQAAFRAFAAIQADGSVVSWGEAADGGDSSEVRDQLKGVRQLQSSTGAFAAILEDGSVVTW
eukprot:symbB.v1.2.039357.t1/scaffold6510.1/size23199/1